MAEIFSLWYAHNYDQTHDVNYYRYELQKKYWELSLWLDAPIFKAVNDALITSGPTIKHKEALSAVRKMLLDNPNDPIPPGDWCHWDAIQEGKP